MRKSFESVSKVDLDSIFNQWVNHTGAPKLQIDETRLIPSKSSWQMRLTLSQQQSFNVYKLYIPIKIELNNGQVINEKIFMDQKVQTVFFNVNEKPKSIVIDPQFDIFRHLYSEEVPPALSEIFGEKSKLNIVLPSNSPYIKKYMLFAEKMKTKYPFNVNIIEDKNITLLPSRGSLWILGWSSKFKTQLQCLFNKAGANFSPSKVTYNGTDFKSNESTLITTLNDRLDTATNCLENNSKQKTAWVGLHQTTDVQTIINKIFHYGSYSFIGFNSNSKNIIKAQWETKNSPLKVHF
jgi:aminopeptidase N